MLLKYSPIENFYLAFGPSLGIKISATTKNDVNGEEYEPKIVTSPILDLKAGIGYNVKISDEFVITPEALFAYPLNNVLNTSDDNKLMIMNFNIALKYAF